MGNRAYSRLVENDRLWLVINQSGLYFPYVRNLHPLLQTRTCQLSINDLLDRSLIYINIVSANSYVLFVIVVSDFFTSIFAICIL